MNLERFKTTKRDVAMSAFYLLGHLGLVSTVYEGVEAIESHAQMRQVDRVFANSAKFGEPINLTPEQRKEFVDLSFSIHHQPLLVEQSLTLSEGQVAILPELNRSYEQYQKDVNRAELLGIATGAIAACGVGGILKERSERKAQLENR